MTDRHSTTSLPEALDPSRTAFFLDFDGTLCEIVERPDMVEVLPRTRDALARLARLTDGAVAIISGRGLDDLDRLLAPLELPAAGSHGAEFRLAPGGAVEETETVHLLDDAADALGPFASEHGLLLERKKGALSLHYRNRPEMADAARRRVAQIADGSDDLRLIDGNMVAELALAATDKGVAVERFLRAPAFAGRVPLMAGDDTTDEDAFAAVLRLGGVALKIGEGPTAAGHRAADTAAFLDWLATTARAMAG